MTYVYKQTAGLIPKTMPKQDAWLSALHTHKFGANVNGVGYACSTSQAKHVVVGQQFVYKVLAVEGSAAENVAMAIKRAFCHAVGIPLRNVEVECHDGAPTWHADVTSTITVEAPQELWPNFYPKQHVTNIETTASDRVKKVHHADGVVETRSKGEWPADETAALEHKDLVRADLDAHATMWRLKAANGRISTAYPRDVRFEPATASHYANVDSFTQQITEGVVVRDRSARNVNPYMVISVSDDGTRCTAVKMCPAFQRETPRDFECDLLVVQPYGKINLKLLKDMSQHFFFNQ